MNLVVRWVTSEQARRYMEYDQIRPSWKHFVPQLGKVRTGICFDMLTTSDWRESSKRIGFVFDPDDISTDVQSCEIVGHRVYELTERLRWVFDKAEMRKLIQEAKDKSGFYSDSPDELFVLGTIDSLGQRLKGVIVLQTGRELGPACSVELDKFTKAYDVPVLKVTLDEFSTIRRAPGGFQMKSPEEVSQKAGAIDASCQQMEAAGIALPPAPANPASVPNQSPCDTRCPMPGAEQIRTRKRKP